MVPASGSLRIIPSRWYIPGCVVFGKGSFVRTIDRVDGKVRLIDQTRLPGEEVWLDLDIVEDLAKGATEAGVLRSGEFGSLRP
jgi:hypothetical protein